MLHLFSTREHQMELERLFGLLGNEKHKKLNSIIDMRNEQEFNLSKNEEIIFSSDNTSDESFQNIAFQCFLKMDNPTCHGCQILLKA